jgi:hypothetical protein
MIPHGADGSQATPLDPSAQALPRLIDWDAYDRLKADGLAERKIADALGIPRSTLRRRLAERTGHSAPDAPGSVPTTALQRIETIGEAVSALERIDSAVLMDHESRIAVLEAFMSTLQHQAHLASAPERISASHPNVPQRINPPVWVNRGTHLAQDMIEAINTYRHQHRLEVREVIDMALRQFFAAQDLTGGAQ